MSLLTTSERAMTSVPFAREHQQELRVAIQWGHPVEYLVIAPTVEQLLDRAHLIERNAFCGQRVQQPHQDDPDGTEFASRPESLILGHRVLPGLQSCRTVGHRDR